MEWKKEQIEDFFGAKFKPYGTFQRIHFENTGLIYELLVNETDSSLWLRVDVNDPDVAYPAFETGFVFGDISMGEAMGVGPVLYFHEPNEKNHSLIRLLVTRTYEGKFSISPNWPSDQYAD